MVPRTIGLLVFVVAVAGCADGDTQGDIRPGVGGYGGSGAGGEGQGGGAAACQLGALGSCGDGRKCTVVDPASGALGCLDTGQAPAWSTCSADSDCVELTYCDGITGVCKPLCDSADDCGGDGRCLPALLALGSPIGGMKLCTADCDPIDQGPCDESLGAVACIAHNPGDDAPAFDCAASGGGTEGSPCTSQTPESSRADCAAGLACVIEAGGGEACRRWCTPPGQQAQCDPGQSCTDAGLSHGGAAYGVCL